MKEFTDPRELIGQIGLDLESTVGAVGSVFRTNIRKELVKLGDTNTIRVSITQIAGGSLISLEIEDWVDKLERTHIAEEFKDLMDRIGANRSGSCHGPMPGNLVAFLNQGAK